MVKYTLAGIAIIIFFLVYNIILAFGSLEGAPKSRTDGPFFPYLTDKPLTEDGYYMLTVAWNIAEGKGFTYNKGIKTTGVQPLATMLYSVPAYLVQNFGGDKYDFARAVIILSALFQIIFAFLIYKISLEISVNPDKTLYFLVSVCVVLLNFKVLLNFANGLETGLYLILLSLFFLYWLRYKQIQPGIMHLLALGLLSGLLLLCRLDSAVILFTFYLLLLYNRYIYLKQLAFIALIGLLVYLPWQLYVLDVTGSILQSSARSQTAILAFADIFFKLKHYSISIVQHLTPFVFTGNFHFWLMFLTGLICIFILVIMYKKFNTLIFSASFKIFFNSISITFIFLLLIYFVFSNAPYFYFRYLSFLMILSFPIIVALIVHLLKRMRRFYISLFLVLVLTIFGLQTYLYLHSGRSPKGLALRVEFVKNNFFEDQIVGSFQTGILGYYCENVINLDGKMDNSALMSYSGKGVDLYMDSMHVDVLMEIKNFIPVFLQWNYLEKYWYVYAEDIGDGETVCYVRKKL